MAGKSSCRSGECAWSTPVVSASTSCAMRRRCSAYCSPSERDSGAVGDMCGVVCAIECVGCVERDLRRCCVRYLLVPVCACACCVCMRARARVCARTSSRACCLRCRRLHIDSASPHVTKVDHPMCIDGTAACWFAKRVSWNSFTRPYGAVCIVSMILSEGMRRGGVQG